MPKLPTRGPEFLDALAARIQHLEAGWLRLYQLIGAYSAPGAPRLQLEADFLNTKSLLAREVPVLISTLGEQAAFGRELTNFLSGIMSLESLFAQSDVAVKKALAEWNRGYLAIHETLGGVQDLQRRVAEGERVAACGFLIYIPKPFPWKRVLAGVVLVLVLVGGGATLYVRREFLGIGAPEAGEGLAFDPSLRDAVQVELLRDQLVDAWKEENLDRFMSVFANDFAGPYKMDKPKLRAILAGMLKTYGASKIVYDLSQAKISVDGTTAMIEPVRIKTPVENLNLRISGAKVKGRWLINRIEEN